MAKISLHGFNNLTKSLSFSLYKLHYLKNNQAHNDYNAYNAYNAYISKHFCADNLTILLTKICHAIGGNVLNVATQDYDPQGASATLMISEEAQPESLVAHLDKSHLCIHTYPDDNPCNNIAIFRADIELSTCGVISPLKVINYLIAEFDADVVDIDYRIRGMTRNAVGEKLFNVDSINNLSDFLSPKISDNFYIRENSFSKQNLYHAKLSKKEIDISKYLVQTGSSDLTDEKYLSASVQLKEEIEQLFNN